MGFGYGQAVFILVSNARHNTDHNARDVPILEPADRDVQTLVQRLVHALTQQLVDVHVSAQQLENNGRIFSKEFDSVHIHRA